MPVFLLGEDPVFPPAQLANEDGIIAVGGDLAPIRLLNAYASGIFPWYSKGEPILWWSPDPRLVILPGDLHVSTSMKRLLKKQSFYVTTDFAFKRVLNGCARKRPNQAGTWITSQMKKAYLLLHELGYAHSVETWERNPKTYKTAKLVGGLYGISLGKAFFGESMFATQPNASKYAFITFAQELFKQGYRLIDCQVPTGHLKSLGAKEIRRTDFLKILQETLRHDTAEGKWDFHLF